MSATEKANCGLSWNGFNVWGDRKSIDEVRAAIHAKDSTVPSLRQTIIDERAALTTQPQAPQGWIPVEDGLPTCNPEPNSFGTPVLVYPPFDDGVSRAHNEAFYGCRQTDEPNFYLFGRVFYPKFWQYPPAAPTKTPEVLE